jgi:D-glycero-alpha-D-manno-heptose-7-phosphate kinase
MIITRTPHRVSFFGGGTDYPSWYLENGGKVLGAAIDKYCYITCRYLPPFFEHKHRIVYSKTEVVMDEEEIQHPSVKAVLKHLCIQKGLEIHHDGDIPARSGMGSSSAFTVGLLKALHALEGSMISKESLSHEAIFIEQKVIKENVGSQDQVWAAYGGINTIEFMENGRIIVEPVIMKEDDLRNFEQKFMLFFTGMARYASEVVQEQINNTRRNRDILVKIRELVDEAYKVLISGKNGFALFGDLLHETWVLKRKLSNRISNDEIDDIYQRARQNGALGGKLLGAGGGGFMLFYAEPEDQEKIKVALKRYLHVPFLFDFSGSEIIVYKPDFLTNGLGSDTI